MPLILLMAWTDWQQVFSGIAAISLFIVSVIRGQDDIAIVQLH